MRLMRKMDLEDKLNQIQLISDGQINEDPSWADKPVGGVFSLTDPALINKYQHQAMESDLKIPILFAYDTIHGYRTIFPIPLGAASSFDPSVASQDHKFGARESAAVGLKQIYSPMVDVSHEPRWGRISEAGGEDPYLNSVFAAARVKAAQGSDYSKADKVVTSVKHYAAYGQPEGGRDYNTTDMSERRLRDLYLPPFKAAVDAGADTAMCSFNAINGEGGCGNKRLETDVLKKEWGFDGFIESDFTAVAELINHGVAGDGPEAAALAMNSGTDSEMVSTLIHDNGAKLVAEGKISERRIDDAVRRILRIKFRAGLFENPYVDVSQAEPAQMRPDAIKAAREASGRSMVLLKNEDGTLPFKKNLKTAVIGPLGDSGHDMLGPWWGKGRDEDAVTVYQGIKAQNPQTTFTEACTMGHNEPPVNKPEDECSSDAGFGAAVAAADAADQVVVAVGETREQSGEAASRSEIDLPGKQEELIARLKTDRQADGGRAVQRPAADARGRRRRLAGDPRGVVPRRPGRSRGRRRRVRRRQPRRQAAGVVPAPGRPGADLLQPREHGPSVRRGLEVHLALPRHPELRPAVRVRLRAELQQVLDHEPAARPQERVAQRERPGDVDVTNVSGPTGDEVVQLYIRDPVASLAQPVRRLRGFERVTLEPGKKKTVTFTLDKSDFGFHDNSGRFIVEPGQIDVYAGNSSKAEMKQSFQVTG